MLAIIPQKSSGWLVITCGPGWMPWIIIAPTISAITGLVGRPSVSIGMNEVCAPALFADSGPATPSIAPLPKRDGSFAMRFSSMYDANDASIAPPPGSTPRTEPMPVPRTIAPLAWRSSFHDGSRRPIVRVRISRPSGASKFAMMPAKPNRPIATTTKPMPSESSGSPNVKRWSPVVVSMPTRPRSTPSAIIATAFSSEPCASTTAATRPSTISEKYSAAPNRKASSARGGAAAARISVAMQPATNDPIAAIASAWPARPLRAIA